MCASHNYHTNKQVRTGGRKVIRLPKEKKQHQEVDRLYFRTVSLVVTNNQLVLNLY